MKEIDIPTWNRKAHFEFFRRMDYPIYNICFDLEIGAYKAFVRERRYSLNNSLVFASIQAANAVENFRYRTRNGAVVLHDRLHPSFTAMDQGSELFKLVTLDCGDDLGEFDRQAKQQVAAQRDYFPLESLKGRDDFIYFSAIPWISFTGLDHTITINRDDAVPRISWGKFREAAGSVLLPYNLQVNHCFIDAIHLGKFKEALEATMHSLEENNA